MPKLLGHFLGIFEIALAQVPLACTRLVDADNTAAARTPFVFDHFADTLLAELHFDAFLAVFVLLAHKVFLRIQNNILDEIIGINSAD